MIHFWRGQYFIGCRVIDSEEKPGTLSWTLWGKGDFLAVTFQGNWKSVLKKAWF